MFYTQKISRQSQLPGSFYQSPTSIGFGFYTVYGWRCHECVKIFCQSDAFAGRFAFIDKEPLLDFTTINRVKGVNDILKTELYCLSVEVILINLAKIKVCTGCQKLAGSGCRLFRCHQQMLTDMAREWTCQLFKRHQVIA